MSIAVPQSCPKRLALSKRLALAVNHACEVVEEVEAAKEANHSKEQIAQLYACLTVARQEELEIRQALLDHIERHGCGEARARAHAPSG